MLKACIPGCESLERTGDNGYKATAAVKIGPISARSSPATSLLTDLEPPNSYRISGEGQGGVAGFAKGGANVALSAEDGAATLLKYDVKAQVGGKIAQLGARLIDATSKQMADMFFDRFTAMVGGPAAEPVETPRATLASPDPAVGGTPLPIPAEMMSAVQTARRRRSRSGRLSRRRSFGFPIVAVIGTVLWLAHLRADLQELCHRLNRRACPPASRKRRRCWPAAATSPTRALATAVHLALVMRRPLFLEGEPGTGKTEIAKVLAEGTRPAAGAAAMLRRHGPVGRSL